MDRVTGAGGGESLRLVVYSLGGKREIEVPGILPSPQLRSPPQSLPPSPLHLNILQEAWPQSRATGRLRLRGSSLYALPRARRSTG